MLAGGNPVADEGERQVGEAMPFQNPEDVVVVFAAGELTAVAADLTGHLRPHGEGGMGDGIGAERRPSDAFRCRRITTLTDDFPCLIDDCQEGTDAGTCR